MFILLHGENTESSRKKLSDLKKEFKGEIISLEAKDLKPESLVQALQSDSLFGNNRKLIVIEGFFSAKNETIPDFSEGCDIIFWEGKKITPAQTAKIQTNIPKLQIEEHKIDSVVFKFLDSIKPDNQAQIIPLWKQYQDSAEPEIAFVMLVRQFRFLLLSQENGGPAPDDFSNLAPWQKQKLKSQADSFGHSQLVNLYQKLQEIDYQTKTGQSAVDLSVRLELFLLSL